MTENDIVLDRDYLVLVIVVTSKERAVSAATVSKLVSEVSNQGFSMGMCVLRFFSLIQAGYLQQENIGKTPLSVSLTPKGEEAVYQVSRNIKFIAESVLFKVELKRVKEKHDNYLALQKT